MQLHVICICARAHALRLTQMSDGGSLNRLAAFDHFALRQVALGNVLRTPQRRSSIATRTCTMSTHTARDNARPRHAPDHRNGKRNRRKLGTEHPGAIDVFAANAECTTTHNLRLEWLQDCHTTARQTHTSKRLPLVLSPHEEAPSGERHPGKRTARTAERGAVGILAARDVLFPRGCMFLRQRKAAEAGAMHACAMKRSCGSLTPETSQWHADYLLNVMRVPLLSI